MIALAKIMTAPIQRPAYNNRRIADPRLWFVDNELALLGYWTALADPDEPFDVDYFSWMSIQHDIEVIRA